MPPDGANLGFVPAARGPLAFMHVPKAAGNAISAGLRRALAPQREVFGWDFSTFGDFRDIASFAPHVRAVFYPEPAAMPADADFVTGHIAYSSIKARYPDARLLTLVREPISRLLSHWMFMRSHQEGGVIPWGTYAPQQRQARRLLADFLNEPHVASQTDNLLCRLLLWPHPLIPDTGFIDPAHDRTLLRSASMRLAAFDFADIVENPALAANLAEFLGRPFNLAVVNETLEIPPEYRSDLQGHLSPQAWQALWRNTRLDQVLWQRLVGVRMKGVEHARLQTQSAASAVARYARLMQPA